MKYYKLIYIIFAIVILQFTSCKKEYEDTGITVQPAPVIEVLGANPFFLLKGLDYTDPGIYTVEYANGDTVEDLDYTILGNVDVNNEGTYTLTYEVKNVNNVPFYAYRTVSVVDFTGYDVFEIPSGGYTGNRVGRVGNGDVTITKIREGIYSCSDLIAGWYDQIVGYGPEYAAPGLLIIEADGNIRSELGYCGFGNVEIQNAKFDAATNILSYRMVLTDQGNFGFNVTLTLK